MDERERERLAHLKLIEGPKADGSGSSAEDGLLHAIRSTPIFSRRLRLALEHGEIVGQDAAATSVFPQYGFLGLREATFRANKELEQSPHAPIRDADMIYANMNAPWSTFICGSQGAGKSHTLSCLLENALSESDAGVLPNPLAGIMFHYDNFTSTESTQVCEAAYLCSQGIPVRVLVSPINLPNMQKLYGNLPGLPAHVPRPRVEALHFRERHLNISNMLMLMAVNDEDRVPLYLAIVKSILREMALERGGAPGVNYEEFKKKIGKQAFTREQTAPLNMRLQLLEDFLEESADIDRIWSFEKGTLTIVDLSCPFINQQDACALFTICLGLFMDGRSQAGRIIALDEAHKFLTHSHEAMVFTEQLVSAIRQERHIATRVLIATQEPTLSPKLLELCNVSIVHRFSSPAWLDTLRTYLAGLSSIKNDKSASEELFRTVVGLRTGQALLFSPEAMLDVIATETGFQPSHAICELKDAFIQIRIRQRVTADGGQSILASDVPATTTQLSNEHRATEDGQSILASDVPATTQLSNEHRATEDGQSVLASDVPATTQLSNEHRTTEDGQSILASDMPPTTLLNGEPAQAQSGQSSTNKTGESGSDREDSRQPRLSVSNLGTSVPGGCTNKSGSDVSKKNKKKKQQQQQKSGDGPAPRNGPVPPKLQPKSQRSQPAAISKPSTSAPVPARPVAPAPAPGRGSKKGKAIQETVVDSALVRRCLSRHVVRSLDQNARHLDFGVIRSAVQADLGLSGNLLDKRESGLIIRTACQQYFADHGIPPPRWL